MRSIDRRKKSTHSIRKRILLICSAALVTTLLLQISGCIKEDYPVRLVLPVVTTTSATAISSTEATTGGEVTSDGGYDVTVRGICWSFEMNPNLADTLLRSATSGSGIGPFAITLDTLKPGMEYHVRAFATNANGTTYGGDIKFTTTVE